MTAKTELRMTVERNEIECEKAHPGISRCTYRHYEPGTYRYFIDGREVDKNEFYWQLKQLAKVERTLPIEEQALLALFSRDFNRENILGRKKMDMLEDIYNRRWIRRKK